MSAHVDHQHVLCLEGLLLTRAFLPPTHKLLLFTVDVVIVDVLEKEMNNFTASLQFIFCKGNFPYILFLFPIYSIRKGAMVCETLCPI